MRSLADDCDADVTLGSSLRHSLFDADGSAIVTHAGPDRNGGVPQAGGTPSPMIWS